MSAKLFKFWEYAVSMKIAFITTYFHPVHGGVENNIFFTAKELVRAGNEVHVFTSDQDNDRMLKPEDAYEGIQIHRCRQWFRYRYYLAFYPALLRKILRVNDFDVIHVHSLGFFWHDFCALFYKARHPKTKLVITPHGPFMTLRYAPAMTCIKKAGDVLIRHILPHYDRVIAVNPLQEEWLSKTYHVNKRKIACVPNGIPEEAGKKQYSTNLAKKLGLKGSIVLSYVGRLNAYKGVAQVLQVLPKILKRRNVLFLIVSSDRENGARMQALVKHLGIEKHVRLLWDCSDREKLQALQCSDIFIMPSQWEAFSIAIVEAMAQGNAIVSTKTEGGMYLIEEFKNGLLFDFGNEKQLEDSLLALLENASLLGKMQEKNIKKARTFYWKNSVRVLAKVYRGESV